MKYWKIEEKEQIIDDKKGFEKILLFGEVQSGKTNKIIDITLKSIEKNYDYAVIFGGTNNRLNKQTIDRFQARIKENSKINNKIIKYKYKSNNINNLNEIARDGFFYIFILMKGDVALFSLYEKLFRFFYTHKKKILIIDDEADYASINISSKKEGKSSKNESKIYNLIKSITNNIENGKLVSVTATPFANIMMDKNDKMYHDKISLIEPNDDYTGLDFFNNKINEIYYGINFHNKNNKDKYYSKTFNNIISKALLLWLVSTSKMVEDNKKKVNNSKSQFLLNIDSEICVHNNVKLKIEEELNKINKWINLTKYDEQIIKILNKKFKIQKKELLNIIKKNIKEISNYIIQNKSIIELNGETNENVDIDKPLYSIITGGTMLSRGITYKYLVTELILNTPLQLNSMDTLLQRARWFGYRKKNKEFLKFDLYKYMTIIMDDKILSSFKEAWKINQLLKQNINKNDIRTILEKYQNQHLKYTKLTGKI